MILLRAAGKTAVWRAMKKMRDGAGSRERESEGMRIFLLPGILLCALPKCIACSLRLRSGTVFCCRIWTAGTWTFQD